MDNKAQKVFKWYIKNKGVPINVSSTNFFVSRLKAFGLLDDANRFVEEVVSECGSFDEFLTLTNKVRESVVNDIKSSEVFKALQERDMNIPEDEIGYPPDRSDKVFTEEGLGKAYISIDMVSANFNALNLYAAEMGLPTLSCLRDEDDPVAGYDYNSYVLKFKDMSCFASKHFREVIFGNCNPKRIVSLEKYYMVELYRYLVRNGMINEENALSLSHDEIVLRYDSINAASKNLDDIVEGCGKYDIPVSVRMFTLSKIEDQYGRLVGYIRKTHNLWESFCKWVHPKDLPSYDMKCVNSTDAIFVRRYLNYEPVQDDDTVFEVDGRFAKLMDRPFLKVTPDLEDEILFRKFKNNGYVY